MGKFTCTRIVSDRYLLVAGGCGVTPIMSMTRWLLKNKPGVDVVVSIVSIRLKMLFLNENGRLLKEQFPQLKLFINASVDSDDGFIAGRLNSQMLSDLVPNIDDYTVLTCGPESICVIYVR